MSGSGRRGRLLCHCLGVTWGEVEDAIRQHRCRRVQQVTLLCKAGGGCRSCHPDIEELIERIRRETPARRGTKGLLARLFTSSKDDPSP